MSDSVTFGTINGPVGLYHFVQDVLAACGALAGTWTAQASTDERTCATCRARESGVMYDAERAGVGF